MSDRTVRDVEVLAELFKAGGWTELRVESDKISLLLSSDRTTAALGEAQARSAPPVAPGIVRPPEPVSVEAATPSAPTSVQGRVDPGWEAVPAPNLGTFYRAPKPGAPPFVEVGQRVEPETEVCLIEVMKLFTSVRAGFAGIVRHIAVADAELVDSGQVLIYIERD